ncbi:MAG: hypothetical protein COW73_05985 [Nitrospirae bacterium CG18_big_fil_WC_8_21_14_2_50_70_55]|nr:DUF192 domain-containing protein [Deltaproteobacteria bacterium]OIP63378.1 MAG: hypothetical protein AUK30_08550 [Nitrospirae bacterium CG2_30_70_394]PIQ05395.1 MAG: hypothetical protein COW73_05985 [Nitrospirae bacterium CG18_big_fil_WC_8_21_14_2_50_70_55]PIU80042.1 MAG: hypothetical protein COS73_01245 [Nitrospirae bacterium CG06_land_8_20_14_3_00_70_43]PIW83516.1 MAG: hypothetical protein COZ96_03050 [Nitrospirae bacterium CG_4_8_14_3_um_filter_70_85]PIX84303.1 MAG: hypothetical protein 
MRGAFALLALVLAASSGGAEEATVAITPAGGGTPLTLHAEVARTPAQQARGLMGRHELAADRGMLFLFPDEQPRTFWMKDCFIALDLLFADRAGRVVHLQHDAPPCPSVVRECPTYSSEQPAAVVLELPAGTAAAHHLAVGSWIRWE